MQVRTRSYCMDEGTSQKTTFPGSLETRIILALATPVNSPCTLSDQSEVTELNSPTIMPVYTYADEAAGTDDSE